MNQQNITHRNFSIIRTAMRINFLLCHFQWILNKYASRQQFSPQRCAARIIHVSKSTSIQTLRSKCCAGVIIFSLIIGAPPCCAGFTVISTYCLRLWHCAKDRQRAEQHCHAKQTGQPSFDIPHFHIKPSFLVLGIVPSFGTLTVSSYCACTDLSITFIIFTLLNSCCFFWGDSNKGLLHRMPCSSPLFLFNVSLMPAR